MLRRLLAGFAIASVLLGLIEVVFWIRSYHHTDHIAIGSYSWQRCDVTSHNGYLIVIKSHNSTGIITSQAESYQHRRFALSFTFLPLLWITVKIRARLPRPGNRPPSARRLKPPR